MLTVSCSRLPLEPRRAARQKARGLSFLVAGQGKQGVHEDDEARGRNGVLEPFFIHASTHWRRTTTAVTAAMVITTFA